MKKTINPKRLFFISMLIDVGSLFIFLFLFYTNAEREPSDWIVIPIVFGSVILVGVILWFFFRPMLREQAIVEKGEPAEAILLDYWDTGTTINDNPLVGMRLEVRPSHLAVYQADTKTVISRLDLGRLCKGASVEVTYLPDNPQKVAFVSFSSSQERSFEPEMGAVGGQSGGPDLIKGRLAELDELRLQHVISETDYQRRRDELLKSRTTVV